MGGSVIMWFVSSSSKKTLRLCLSSDVLNAQSDI